MKTVTVSRRYDASPERVFDAWLDPARARRFLFATPDGEMVRAEIDPRVGGRFLFIDRRQGGDAEHFGVYREIDRPRRLVFAFAVDRREPETDWSLVTVTIRPDGAGCVLTLTHEKVPAEYADRAEAGWTMILESLAGAA